MEELIKAIDTLNATADELWTLSNDDKISVNDRDDLREVSTDLTKAVNLLTALVTRRLYA